MGISDLDGNVMIRVIQRRRHRSRSRTPLLTLDDDRPRRRRRYQPLDASEADTIRRSLPAPPPPPPELQAFLAGAPSISSNPMGATSSMLPGAAVKLEAPVKTEQAETVV